jgi:hypothetical protein
MSVPTVAPEIVTAPDAAIPTIPPSSIPKKNEIEVTNSSKIAGFSESFKLKGLHGEGVCPQGIIYRHIMDIFEALLPKNLFTFAFHLQTKRGDFGFPPVAKQRTIENVSAEVLDLFAGESDREIAFIYNETEMTVIAWYVVPN